MVRPTRPKEMKPKADTTGAASTGMSANLEGNKLLIVNAVTTLIICILFLGGTYFIVDTIVSSKLANLSTGEDHEEAAEEHQAEETNSRGLILDLGEFILNLSDTKSRRFLKVNVALELSKKPSDPDPMAAAHEGGGGGHGGHGAAAPDPMKIIELEMSQYKPAVRDAIISTLSSKTTDELLSIPGKDLAKEQIKEAVDAIFNGEREVMRVSFGNFIIQ